MRINTLEAIANQEILIHDYEGTIYRKSTKLRNYSYQKYFVKWKFVLWIFHFILYTVFSRYKVPLKNSSG